MDDGSPRTRTPEGNCLTSPTTSVDSLYMDSSEATAELLPAFLTRQTSTMMSKRRTSENSTCILSQCNKLGGKVDTMVIWYFFDRTTYASIF